MRESLSGQVCLCGFLADESLSSPSTQEVKRQEGEEFKVSLDCVWAT